MLLLKFSSSGKIINNKAKQELMKLEPYFSAEKLHMININIEKDKEIFKSECESKVSFRKPSFKFLNIKINI